MGNYIILVDPDEKVLAIQTTALEYFYTGEIVVLNSNREVIDCILKRGRPEVLFIDFKILLSPSADLMGYLSAQKIHVPIISSSHDANDQKLIVNYPQISILLEKPINSQDFTFIIKGIISAPKEAPIYVPVSLDTMLMLSKANYDYYLCLAKENFVKIVHQGDLFNQADADALKQKGFNKVYIKSSDCLQLLDEMEKVLLTASRNDSKTPPEEQLRLGMQSLVEIETFSRINGWSPEIVENTKKAVQASIKILSMNHKIISGLNAKLSDHTSPYARHVGLLCYLVCALGSKFDWVGETGKMKLVMASMLHDFTVDNTIYKDNKPWNSKAADIKERTPEVSNYRMHPVASSQLAKSLESLPADIDQIILQHHERPDGSGFPKAIGASRISHLSTLFILIEDLVEIINDGSLLELSVDAYLVKGKKIYTQGNFKKFFSVISQELAHSEF